MKKQTEGGRRVTPGGSDGLLLQRGRGPGEFRRVELSVFIGTGRVEQFRQALHPGCVLFAQGAVSIGVEFLEVGIGGLGIIGSVNDSGQTDTGPTKAIIRPDLLKSDFAFIKFSIEIGI